jgi:hypothetical protein
MLGVATRTAYSIGLHREFDPEALNTGETTGWCATMWSVLFIPRERVTTIN